MTAVVLISHFRGMLIPFLECIAMKSKNSSISRITHFSYKQHLFSTQPQGCLTFSWIELQMLLRLLLNTCKHHYTEPLFYILYLWPCLDQATLNLDLLMLHLCDIFFIFIFLFIVIDRVMSWINTRSLFCSFFRICPIIFGW